MKLNTLIVGLLWSVLYFVGAGWFLQTVFTVTPFVVPVEYTSEAGWHFFNPLMDWGKLYQAFIYDQWVIDNGFEVLRLFSFLFFFPVWILGWYLLSKIQWIQKLKGPLHFYKRRSLNKVQVPLKKPTLTRPQSLHPNAFGRHLGATVSASPSTPLVPSIPQAAELEASSEQQGLTPDIVAEIKALGEAKGFETFENVLLGKYTIPMVLATDTKALMFQFLTTEQEWVADETPSEGNTEPTWFSAEGLKPSPFYQLKQAALFLSEKEPDSQIIPVLVVLAGSILNAETMMPYWTENQGFVVRFKEGKPEILQRLEEFIASQAEEDIEK